MRRALTLALLGLPLGCSPLIATGKGDLPDSAADSASDTGQLDTGRDTEADADTDTDTDTDSDTDTDTDTATPLAGPGDLVLNEIMQNPGAVADDAGEWFEVYVSARSTVDLTGVVVSDSDGNTFTIKGLVGEPGALLVFSVGGDPTTNGGLDADFVYADLGLGNDDDALTLTSAEGALIDTVAWDNGATFPDTSGASMTLMATGRDATANDLGAAWCSASSPYGAGDLGTPGTANDGCDATDVDHDGYDADADCDDSDAAVHPGAFDSPGDGIDQDCDGTDAVVLAGPGDLLLTEVMQNPSVVADAEGEWFEVQVTSRTEVSLEGVQVEDTDGNTFVITGLIASPGDHLVFAANGDSAVNGGVAVDFVYTGLGMGNDDDGLTLTTADGVVIDTVVWDNGATFPDPNGASMTLAADALDRDANDLGAAWCAGTSVYGRGDLGTPGAANDDCAAGPLDEDLDGYDTTVDCDDTSAAIHPGAPETRGDGIDQDCDGADTPAFAGAGDLLITEIFQNPAAVGDGVGEWFEVHITATAAVDLDGLTVSDDDGNSFTVRGLIGAPGDYLVLAINSDTATNGGVLVDFDYDGLGMDNGSDHLTIESASGGLLDTVAWDDGATFPDPDGASMTLSTSAFDPGDNDDGSAWCVAVTPFGSGDLGTPGAPNDACDTTATIASLAPGDLVITEIMQNPTAVADDAGEWFELTNTTGRSFNLEGLVISDAGSDTFTVTGDLLIGAGEAIVFGVNGDTAANGSVPVAYAYGSAFTLGNSDDELILTAPVGIVDEVDYDGGPDFPDPSGSSMTLDPGSTDASLNDDGGAWCVAPAPWASGDDGSPGLPNDPC